MPAPLLEARGVDKAFPGVRALSCVDFVLHRGEVVALIGENGAGKSTLMKVLAGVHQPDAGEIRLDGTPIVLRSPAAALAAGIALIHQELSLCDNLTVAGALFLGAELRRGPFLRRRAMQEHAHQSLRRLGLEVDPRALVASLSPGQKQLLEIARALRANAQVLIMDEPTSSLTRVEAERLFAVTRELEAQGRGIVYVSHRLGEVLAVADRVVGLRDGHNSGEMPVGDATHENMVAMMVGRTLSNTRREAHAPGEVVLRVRGLRTQAFPRAAVDLDLRAGEIVGIAGLLGSGRSELLRALFGADRARAGRVEVNGVQVAGHDPAAAVAAGLVLLPEDRKAQGLVLGMSVMHNLSLPTLHRRGRFVDAAYERGLSERSIAELSIAASGGNQVASTLSGGNQQKVVLGKWLAAEPSVLLLDEPTRGVDVGARAEIYTRLHELAARGLAVLFVSSDLDEVLALADRAVVLHQGAVAGELAREQLSEESVMMLATSVEVP
ncbi:MAG TPA: sugar ABC transporter ATP-binding protein [Planctomycetota bacterium]|nr:sugar ABC transporter ATP-binding protein [Planctomycetota bacterium]